MTFNRGKFIYFLKKVCNRLLTIIEVTRKGTCSQNPHVPATRALGPTGTLLNQPVWGMVASHGGGRETDPGLPKLRIQGGEPSTVWKIRDLVEERLAKRKP